MQQLFSETQNLFSEERQKNDSIFVMQSKNFFLRGKAGAIISDENFKLIRDKNDNLRTARCSKAHKIE